MSEQHRSPFLTGRTDRWVETITECVNGRRVPDHLAGEDPLGEPVKAEVAERPSRKELPGASILLAPLDPVRDVADLYSVSHGSVQKESVWTYLGYGPFASEREMTGWLEERAASDDPLFFAVIDRASSSRLGMVSFLNIETQARCIELGHIWYGPEFQRRAVNTEAMSLMLEEAFERLRARRVEWKCDALNDRSRAAALRLGFRFEGIFRQHLIVKGRNRDTAWFSMLDGEWPRARTALRRWLDCKGDSRPSLIELREREGAAPFASPFVTDA